MKPKLQVIICSTRPGRVGSSVAQWFASYARAHDKFEVTLIDLADFALPLYDEPNHPSLQKYEKEHTKKWSQSVNEGDAYVFVLPEYNYGPPPSFVNALNYVYKEWNYKPCAFVSYGGISGGLRGVQASKQLVTALKMMPMFEGVPIPMVATLLDSERKLQANELIAKGAGIMLDELLRWTEGLNQMRAKLRQA